MDMHDASPTLDLVPGHSYWMEEEEEGWGTMAACDRPRSPAEDFK